MCIFLKLLSDTLNFNVGNCNIKFNRSVKVGDMYTYFTGQNPSQVIEVATSKIDETFPWLHGHYLIFKLNNHIVLQFERNFLYKHCLESFYDPEKLQCIFLEDNYEVANCEFDYSMDSLRLKCVSEVLSALLNRLCQPETISRMVPIPIHLIKSNLPSSCDGIYITVGPIFSKDHKPSAMAPTEFVKVKQVEVEAMSSHKLASNEAFKQVEQLVADCIEYDMVHSAVHKAIVLDCENIPSTTREAVFILYNYARIEALCHQFDTQVKSGNYPEIPEFDEIDFSKLILQEEWVLFFDFIISWPMILMSSLEDLKSGKIKIHKIINFLNSLASTFSRYYHRTRILTKSRPNLIPTVHARMVLIKCLKNVWLDCLTSINLNPVGFM